MLFSANKSLTSINFKKFYRMSCYKILKYDFYFKIRIFGVTL